MKEIILLTIYLFIYNENIFFIYLLITKKLNKCLNSNIILMRNIFEDN